MMANVVIRTILYIHVFLLDFRKRKDSDGCGAAAAAAAATDDDDQSAAEDLVSIDSGEVSAAETVEFEARNRRESEYHVFGLICERKWTLAVAYYRRQHQRRWGGGGGGGSSGAGGGGVVVSRPLMGLAADQHVDDVEVIMKLYCQILAEKGERKYFIVNVWFRCSRKCSNGLKDE